MGNKGKQKLPVTTRHHNASLVSHIVTFVLGIVAAIVIPLLLDRLSIVDSKLVAITDKPPDTPSINLKREAGVDVLHLKIAPKFKNYGFKRGHVDKAAVMRDGLTEYPDRIETIYLNKSDLGWLEEKKVDCEFRVIIDPRNLTEKQKTISFKVVFYGTTGNELYWEKLEIEGWLQKGPLGSQMKAAQPQGSSGQ